MTRTTRRMTAPTWTRTTRRTTAPTYTPRPLPRGAPGGSERVGVRRRIGRGGETPPHLKRRRRESSKNPPRRRRPFASTPRRRAIGTLRRARTSPRGIKARTRGRRRRKPNLVASLAKYGIFACGDPATAGPKARHSQNSSPYSPPRSPPPLRDRRGGEAERERVDRAGTPPMPRRVGGGERGDGGGDGCRRRRDAARVRGHLRDRRGGLLGADPTRLTLTPTPRRRRSCAPTRTTPPQFRAVRGGGAGGSRDGRVDSASAAASARSVARRGGVGAPRAAARTRRRALGVLNTDGSKRRGGSRRRAARVPKGRRRRETPRRVPEPMLAHTRDR